MTQLLVRLEQATVRRGPGVILKNIDFALHAEEDWLVTGNNGAGKSSFMRLLRGDIWPVPGINGAPRLYFTDGRAGVSPLAFKRKTGWVSPELLDRYRAKGWDLSVFEVLISGLRQTALPYHQPTEKDGERAEQQAELFGLTPLLWKKFLGLSQGEALKVLVARALINSPRVLFVDEIGPSLDHRSRAAIRDVLLQARSNRTQLIVAAHEPDGVSSRIHNSVVLESGRIVFQGPNSAPKAAASGSNSGLLKTEDTRPKRKQTEPGPYDLQVVRSHEKADQEEDPETPPAIHIQGVEVRIRGQTVLKDFSWRINQGEHWGLTGANGSGKSTLLRLILGEIHPLPGGRIIRFGMNEPVNIWELKQRIGFFSPELQSRHFFGQSVLETVATGFQGHLGSYKPAATEQLERALARLEDFSIDDLQDRDIRTLSYGQLRKTLLLRAVVHSPRMVLLDEPCAGLDRDNRERFLSCIQQLAENRTQIVMATHRSGDFIPGITKVLELSS